MRKKRVYIAGPITKGDLLGNVNRATDAFVQLAKAGFAPLCPHWSVYSKPAFHLFPSEDFPRVLCEATRNGNEEMSHEDWIGIDLEWVRFADCVLRLDGESSGADAEVEHAQKLGIPIYYSLDTLILQEGP